MKIYRRSDGFEVQDALNRDISWAEATYPLAEATWEEIALPTPPDPAVIAAEAQAKEAKKQSGINKLKALGLTDDEIAAMIGG